MTYKQALQIAIKQLDDAVDYLRATNKGFPKVEKQIEKYASAIDALRKELGIADVQNALLDAVELAVRKGNANTDTQEAYEEYEAKLKEKNT